jgi:hypothetical protein
MLTISMSRWDACKALAGRDTVLVDHTESAKTHEAGVVMLAERERVPAVEPVEARV